MNKRANFFAIVDSIQLIILKIIWKMRTGKKFPFKKIESRDSLNKSSLM